MTTRREVLRALGAAGLAAALPTARAQQVPPGYPGTYAKVISAAAREQRLVVWGATDDEAAAPLVRDFEALYPAVKVDYRNSQSNEIYEGVLARDGVDRGIDVAWSSAMDLQIKLVNDGYAQTHASPEAPRLPPWAVWRNEAFGTTVEPIVLAYNKRLLEPALVPRSHAELQQLLENQKERLAGRVVTYDPELSGLGFLLLTQDVHVSGHGFWALARALGAVAARGLDSTSAMIGEIASGASVIGYNLVGTYADALARRQPDLGIVLLQDYTLVISRIMFITRKAPHPNAARLWLDYVLSRRGQDVLAARSGLYAIRNNGAGAATGAALHKQLGDALRPVSVGPGLLTYLDQSKRHEFLRRWNEAFASAG